MRPVPRPGRFRRPILWALALLAAAVVALPAGMAAGATGSATQVAPGCTAVGTWVHVTADIGSTTWTVDAGGQATETGIGFATGTATLSGQELTITFVANDRVTTGAYRWTLAQDCASGTGSLTMTGPPSRNGETHVSTVTRTGGPPAAPAPTAPAIVPRATRPVPGALTSYAAPRPGRPAALPFPAAGCRPPAALLQVAPPGPVQGSCEVDIFLRRKGGGLINDPDAVFAGGLQVSHQNQAKAARVCVLLLLSRHNSLEAWARDGTAGGDFATCALAVARILQRADDLQRARRRPNERVAHAARRCSVLGVRVRGGARGGAPPVRTTCRRTASGVRMTFLSNRRGQAVGDLIDPSSKLIVGRSDETRFRAGDRVEVRWTVS
ncbi:MAG: hypothetical protein AB7V62_02450 [Thermoleophilia bacterium]